jgi:hypothetical protein
MSSLAMHPSNSNHSSLTYPYSYHGSSAAVAGTPPPQGPAARKTSMDLSSLHRMRRASLVTNAHNHHMVMNDASQVSHDSMSSSCSGVSFAHSYYSGGDAPSVKFTAKNFVTQRPGTLESFYSLGDLLGSGGFGEVYSCVHKETGSERAVKVLIKNQEDEALNEQVIREFNMLRTLDSPNLLKVFEMYEDITHFYIVTEIYNGGDLFSELEEGGAFLERDAAMVMNTLLSCSKYRVLPVSFCCSIGLS